VSLLKTQYFVMKTVLNFALLVLLLSCVNHEFPFDDDNLPSIQAIAAKKCGHSDMGWFATVLQQAQGISTTGYTSTMGYIYAVSVDGRVLFIHQPLIMSCLACIIYDCYGNRVDIATVDLQKVAAAMTPANLLYTPLGPLQE
jgi:hypothetical protein